jgi:hypothetical protein
MHPTDFHSLREWRGRILDDSGASLSSSMLSTSIPDASDVSLQRELASIHRSDLTLVCSSVEIKMLRERYGIAADKLVYAPFFVDCER